MKNKWKYIKISFVQTRTGHEVTCKVVGMTSAEAYGVLLIYAEKAKQEALSEQK